MNLEKIELYLDNIYTLKHIIRYNTVPKIVKENVAEHSFFVSSIVLKLYEDYDFELEKALIMAITHDYVEIYISDVPRNVKNKYPLLNKTLENVERQAWKDLFPQFNDYNVEFETQETNESLIVKLADSLSIIQYSQSEVKLGNSGYMRNVYDFTKANVDEYFKKIEYMKRDK